MFVSVSFLFSYEKENRFIHPLIVVEVVEYVRSHVVFPPHDVRETNCNSSSSPLAVLNG